VARLLAKILFTAWNQACGRPNAQRFSRRHYTDAVSAIPVSLQQSGVVSIRSQPELELARLTAYYATHARTSYVNSEHDTATIR
jgi:hypothetical protein